MKDFEMMGLVPELLKAIGDLGFVSPTPIQEKVIPMILEGDSDIIGLAQTGTGKTAAFGLPLLQHAEPVEKKTRALILSPTRELCVQISKDLQAYAKYLPGIRIVPVYGGASVENQVKDLKRGAHIIVATPGRMLDLIKRKYAKIADVKRLILDEADEMLHMGFRDELNAILEYMPIARQSLLFSATMSKEVAAIAAEYLNEPEKITIGVQNAGAENIQHIYYQVHETDRYAALKRIADINPDIYGIVFCRTRRETKEIADKLIKDGYNADALHGDLSQSQRDHVMKRFRERSLQMLVATDVAARGIDVQNISHVINYKLPEELEVYTHRSGRTGRADKSGVAISIINYREVSRIARIEKIIRKKCVKQPVPGGPEICRKQLFNMIDKMEKAQVDEAQIEPFMSEVNKKLEWLSKEEIIKHFVSTEFNRFLDYYKNAPDLNAKADNKIKKTRNKDRAEGRDNRQQQSDIRFQRFFINIGKKEGLNPANIIGLINDHTKDRDITIGQIDMKDNFSFFEIDMAYADKIMKAFNNSRFGSRKLSVEVAEEKKNKNHKSRSQKDRSPKAKKKTKKHY